jgi:hypothetical protein
VTDAYDSATLAASTLGDISGIFSAIKSLTENEKYSTVYKLACVGQYLSDDWGNTNDVQAEYLKEKIDAYRSENKLPQLN